MECTRRHYLFITIILGILSVSLIIAICVIKNKETDKPCQVEDTCMNKDCLETASMILNSINKSVNPCDDFYEHSCGNWIASHKISPRGNSAGIFLDLRNALSERLRDLLEGTDDDNLESIKQGKSLFQSCNDINSIELFNITDLISNLSKINDRQELLLSLAQYDENYVFPITLTQDVQNSSISKIYFPIRKPILNNQTNKNQFRKLVERFKDFIDTNAVISMEKNLSTLVWNTTKENEIISVSEFSKYMEWDIANILNMFLSRININHTIRENDTVYVQDKYYSKQLITLINESTYSHLRDYAIFRSLLSLSVALPLQYRTAVDDYMKEIESVKYSPSRDIICARKVNSLLPITIGRLYVDIYFKDSTRKKVGKLVEDIRHSMLKIFSSSDWMDKTTKDFAAEKANAVLDIIGYTTALKNRANFESFMLNFTGNDFLINLLSWQALATRSRFASLNWIMPRNRTSIPPAMVNAFYSPQQNSINFPAGILQKPFFDENYPNPLLYGVFGAVVGHEFTHGFDNQGSLYDKLGNKKNWWRSETKEKFNKRAEGLKKQYAEFNLCKGKPDCRFKIDGQMTLGENIADNGGLKAAYNAYKSHMKTNNIKYQKLPGVDYTEDQLFFAGFAHIWCRKETDKSLFKQLKDAHSPARARVMVTLMNSKEFASAFNCPLNSKMNPKVKHGVW